MTEKIMNHNIHEYELLESGLPAMSQDFHTRDTGQTSE